MFISKLVDAAGEAGETEVWLDVSKDAGYLSAEDYNNFISKYEEINRMLYGMIDKHEKFCRQTGSKCVL